MPWVQLNRQVDWQLLCDCYCVQAVSSCFPKCCTGVSYKRLTPRATSATVSVSPTVLPQMPRHCRHGPTPWVQENWHVFWQLLWDCYYIQAVSSYFLSQILPDMGEDLHHA